MRILFTSYPAYGHVNAMLPLARQARGAGHEETELAGALHSLLLPHCTLVVSHGGAGIMLSALAHGLPQLILPQGADQFTNATTCQSAGAALALRPDELSADALAAAAERLITDPAFRHAAAGIQAEIDAMPSACDVLCVLVYGCAS